MLFSPETVAKMAKQIIATKEVDQKKETTENAVRTRQKNFSPSNTKQKKDPKCRKQP